MWPSSSICSLVPGGRLVDERSDDGATLLMRLVVDKPLRIWVWILICLAVVFWTGGAKIGAAVLSIFLLHEVHCGKWSYYAGSISYSLNLTHVIVMIDIGKQFGASALYEVALTVARSLSLLFAFLSHRAESLTHVDDSGRLQSV
jgi:hypothetical protein